jgi:hypothetical protein
MSKRRITTRSAAAALELDLEDEVAAREVPAGEADDEFDSSRVLRFPVSIVSGRAASIAPDATLLEIAQTRAEDPSIFEEEGRKPYFWRASISNNRLDAYFSRMQKSSLKNYAADLDEGVAFLDSHDSRRLGLGYSLKGKFVGPGGNTEMRTLGAFYTVPGLQLANTDTTNFIAAVRSGLARDVSVGFYGGKSLCSICGNEMWSWTGTYCPHWPGETYEVLDSKGNPTGKMEMAVELIEDAHLAEVSAVYDGACPGAAIVKAMREVEAGRVPPELARTLEAHYRIRLPGSRHAWAGIGEGENMNRTKPNTPATPAEPTAEERAAQEEADRLEAEETRRLEEEAETQRQADETAQREAEDARQRTQARLADETRIDAEARAAIQVDLTRLNDENTRLRTELERLTAENTRLSPLADMGSRYRTDLIEDAITQGVRALGERFQVEQYRTMLANCTIEQIEAVRSGFAEQGKTRFVGGRHTTDDAGPEERDTGEMVAMEAPAWAHAG